MTTRQSWCCMSTAAAMTFAFSDPTPSADLNYEWNSTGLDWSSTSEVTLRLREAVASTDATLSGLVGQRRQRGPDADADLRIGHVHLHGLGGEHRRRGDGDADEERRRRDDRVPGRVRYDARRQRHLGGRPAGGAGPGRHRHQGEGDGRGRQRHPDLHGDGDPGEPDLHAEHRRHLVRGRHGGGDRNIRVGHCIRIQFKCR